MQKDREIQSIALLTSHLPQAPLTYGIGDDCALIENGNHSHVVTMDSLVEGVHFDEKWNPSDVGWKLVASNVSDIVAMGRKPKYCTFSISLPSNKRESWLPMFQKGFLEALETWNIHLVGGDITRSQRDIFLSLTLHSTSEPSTTKYPKAIFRCGAQVGDDIFVTGDLGNAAAFFLQAITNYRRPRPPVDFAIALRKQNLISAMMDVSDGISQDLPILCQRSHVCGHIFEERLPHNIVHGELTTSWLTSFGEDFELLLTSPSKHRSLLQSLSQKHQVKLTRIGVIQEKRKNEQWLYLYNNGTEIPFPKPLFQHFC
jgi:thiamine-monophosphate kinase